MENLRIYYIMTWLAITILLSANTLIEYYRTYDGALLLIGILLETYDIVFNFIH